jgi:hypothetical protein
LGEGEALLEFVQSISSIGPLGLKRLRLVENQAQRRREDTAEAAVGQIRVNGIRPVRTDG